MAATYAVAGQYEYTTGTGQGAELIKTYYLDRIRDVFYKKTPLLDRLKKVAPKKMVGNAAVIAIRAGFDPGFGGVSEGLATPAPYSTARDQATVETKEMWHSIAMSTKQLKVARGDKTSFVNALTDKVRGATESFQNNMDRMSWGDGSGHLCALLTGGTAGASETTTEVTVSAAADLRHLYENMQVDVIDASSTTYFNNTTGTTTTATYHLKVSAIDTSGPGFTLSIPAGGANYMREDLAVGDNVLSAGPLATRVYDASGTGNSYYEMMGLKGIISASDPTTGDFQGLDRSTYTWWKAAHETSSSSTNRDLTEKLMIAAYNGSLKNGGEPSAIYCDLDVQREYSALLTPSVRNINTLDLTGGWSALAFQCGGKPIPVFGSKGCAPNLMYFVDEKHLFFVECGDVEWISGGGAGGVMTWDIGYAQKIGALQWVGNLACDHPGSCCLLDYIKT